MVTLIDPGPRKCRAGDTFVHLADRSNWAEAFVGSLGAYMIDVYQSPDSAPCGVVEVGNVAPSHVPAALLFHAVSRT